MFLLFIMRSADDQRCQGLILVKAKTCAFWKISSSMLLVSFQRIVSNLRSLDYHIIKSSMAALRNYTVNQKLHLLHRLICLSKDLDFLRISAFLLSLIQALNLIHSSMAPLNQDQVEIGYYFFRSKAAVAYHYSIFREGYFGRDFSLIILSDERCLCSEFCLSQTWILLSKVKVFSSGFPMNCSLNCFC